MDVNPQKSLPPSQSPVKPSSKKRSTEVAPSKDSGKGSSAGGVKENFSLHEAIRASLEAMPEVRRHLVETGRELARDENYPSAENLDELSQLALDQYIEERKANRSR